MSWVTKICDDYGISIYKLSQLTGISEQTLYAAAKRNSKLSNYRIIKKLADEFCVDVEELEERYM